MRSTDFGVEVPDWWPPDEDGGWAVVVNNRVVRWCAMAVQARTQALVLGGYVMHAQYLRGVQNDEADTLD
jgi:hypothetical protein